jgi:hypothetical protein
VNAAPITWSATGCSMRNLFLAIMASRPGAAVTILKRPKIWQRAKYSLGSTVCGGPCTILIPNKRNRADLVIDRGESFFVQQQCAKRFFSN